MQPRIGITCVLDANTQRYQVGKDYTSAIIDAGGMPLLIPPQEIDRELLKTFQGIVFSGGGDFSRTYLTGEVNTICLQDVDYERDLLEMKLVRLIWDNDFPCLGICRGMQLLNLALGGSIFNDLSSENKDFINHHLINTPEKYHQVKIAENNMLQEVIQQEWISVNSRHHQGVNMIAPELQAIAWAEDGLVEALAAKQKRFFIGVQWHPEKLPPFVPAARKIFQLFVENCRKLC